MTQDQMSELKAIYSNRIGEMDLRVGNIVTFGYSEKVVVKSIHSGGINKGLETEGHFFKEGGVGDTLPIRHVRPFILDQSTLQRLKFRWILESSCILDIDYSSEGEPHESIFLTKIQGFEFTKMISISLGGGTGYKCRVSSIHELQNAYFNATGKEFKIKI